MSDLRKDPVHTARALAVVSFATGAIMLLLVGGITFVAVHSDPLEIQRSAERGYGVTQISLKGTMTR
jgi:hypothetical protein